MLTTSSPKVGHGARLRHPSARGVHIVIDSRSTAGILVTAARLARRSRTMRGRIGLLCLAAAIAASAPAPLGAQPAPRAHQDRHRARDRRGPPAPVRQFRRAPRALHLRRHLRGEAARSSDADGFRKDVMEATRGLGVTMLRWPGGNFASGYNWKDGIGPRDQRPVRRDHAWGALESQPLRHRRVPALLRDASGSSPTSASTPDSAPSTTRATGWSTRNETGEHLLGAAAAQERPRASRGT